MKLLIYYDSLTDKYYRRRMFCYLPPWCHILTTCWSKQLPSKETGMRYETGHFLLETRRKRKEKD
jgi:hypothetical protein